MCILLGGIHIHREVITGHTNKNVQIHKNQNVSGSGTSLAWNSRPGDSLDARSGNQGPGFWQMPHLRKG